jgi:hypothetical protein
LEAAARKAVEIFSRRSREKIEIALAAAGEQYSMIGYRAKKTFLTPKDV